MVSIPAAPRKKDYAIFIIYSALATGLMLLAGNARAEATNTSSADVVGNLGFFSTVAGTLMMYAKYISFFMAIISLLALWVSGMLGKLHQKNRSNHRRA